MNKTLNLSRRDDETQPQALARVTLTPECLSAAVLVTCHNLDHDSVTAVSEELRQQTTAINNGDMTRAEDMLLAQAHTLDGLFSKLASKALVANHMDNMERYLRLALKAQNQSRATLQTLTELKAPKQIAFVQQANIGNQIQVNNHTREKSPRAQKTQNQQNELLEVEHGERLDTRTQSKTSRDDSALEAVGEKHRPPKPSRQVGIKP